jgi:hypothetical protein
MGIYDEYLKYSQKLYAERTTGNFDEIGQKCADRISILFKTYGSQTTAQEACQFLMKQLKQEFNENFRYFDLLMHYAKNILLIPDIKEFDWEMYS